jgi:regulatory protein YycH of two-component signal transduction system YycFG
LYAYQALLSYFSEDNYDYSITNIDMGYKIPDEESQTDNESSEMSPVWRIRIKGADEPAYLD